MIDKLFFPSLREDKIEKNLRNKLMTLDYRLFRKLPNGASLLGSARAEK